MTKFVPISTAASALGVSASTLRRWEASGKLVPSGTQGGQRRYDLATLCPTLNHTAPASRWTIAYARVSSHDQKAGLERQKQALTLYCGHCIADLGSGMNYQKKGLTRLLDSILNGQVGRLVLTHKDRLLRFGAELVFAICQAREVEVVIINQGKDSSFEEDLASDVLEIITVFSARLQLYRTCSRSHRNQKLIDGVRQAVRETQC